MTKNSPSRFSKGKALTFVGYLKQTEWRKTHFCYFSFNLEVTASLSLLLHPSTVSIMH